MLTAGKKRLALQLFDSGYALYQEQRYEQAVIDLHRAEDLFRKLDARGRPFGIVLSTGVSGLASSLFWQGCCYQATGAAAKAIACYESSLINAKFERRTSFLPFLKTVHEHLAACYELQAAGVDEPRSPSPSGGEPSIDSAFRFPFSLDPDSIPFARLYELAPERHAHLKDWYARAKKKDLQVRRSSRTTDEATMRPIGILVWGALVVVWLTYGLMVVRTLLQHK